MLGHSDAAETSFITATAGLDVLLRDPSIEPGILCSIRI